MIKVANQEKRENEPPIDRVLNMKNQGLSDDQIIRDLQREGFSYEEIFEALNQSEIKTGVAQGPTGPYSDFEMPTLPEAPSTSMQPSMMSQKAPPMEEAPERVPEREIPYEGPVAEQVEQISAMETIPLAQPTRGIEEQIEEVAESIIDEKWQRVTEEVGDLAVWKETVRREIISVKQELLRFEKRFEDLQKSILGRVKEYDRGITDVGTEIKALEKVLKDIIKPLTTNVRELSRLIKEIKRK